MSPQPKLESRPRAHRPSSGSGSGSGFGPGPAVWLAGLAAIALLGCGQPTSAPAASIAAALDQCDQARALAEESMSIDPALDSGGQKSLYVNIDINTSPIRAYAILPSPAYLTAQASSIQTGPGGVGLAIDSTSRTLLATYEGSTVIKALDARTLKPLAESAARTDATSFAGIVFDEHAQRLYVVDRSTSHLFVYTWDPAAKALAAQGGANTLAGVSAAHGIALDETRDLLYVADLTSEVKVFHTGDWSPAGTVTVPQPAMSVAVDEIRQLLYTGNAQAAAGCTGLLVRTDLTTAASTSASIRSRTGCKDDCVVGLAVDQDTGLVYLTTGDQDGGGSDQLMVFDSSLGFLYATYDIGSPTGLAVPRAPVTYNPLWLTKTAGVADGACAAPGSTITYTITLRNPYAYPIGGVVLTDTLPPQVDFVSASSGYTRSGSRVTWTLADRVMCGESLTFTLVVRVQDGVPSGTTVENRVSLYTYQTGTAYAAEQTLVCSNRWPVAIALPDDVPIECTSPLGAPVTLDGTRSYDPDAGDVLAYAWSAAAPLAGATSPTATGTFPLGSHEATLTVTDRTGASAADTASFAVVDTTPPAIRCPAPMEVPAEAGCLGTADPAALATDVCDAAPALTRSPAGVTWPVGTTPITFTATDASGNAASCTTTVTVLHPAPPAIDCNAHPIAPPDAPISFTATATSACGAVQVEITGYDCWTFNGQGKRISKLQSCVVSFRGDTLTIEDAGGVGDHIEWTVTATSAGGDTTTTTCAIEVQHPWHGR